MVLGNVNLDLSKSETGAIVGGATAAGLPVALSKADVDMVVADVADSILEGDRAQARKVIGYGAIVIGVAHILYAYAYADGQVGMAIAALGVAVASFGVEVLIKG